LVLPLQAFAWDVSDNVTNTTIDDSVGAFDGFADVNTQDISAAGLLGTSLEVSKSENIGKTSNGTSQTTGSADRKAVSLVTTVHNVYLLSIKARCWVASTATVAKAVVYAADGSGGAPGTLVAESDEVAISNTTEAEITFPFSVADYPWLDGSTNYYIGLHWKNPGSTNFLFSRANTSNLVKANADTYSDGASSSFGTVTNESGAIDAYLVGKIACTLTLDSSIDNLSTFAIEFTFKSGIQNAWAQMFIKGAYDFTPPTWGIQFDSDESSNQGLYVRVDTSVHTNAGAPNTITGLVDGNWHHIVYNFYTETLNDSFDNNDIDPKYNVFTDGGGSVVETNQRLEMTTVASAYSISGISAPYHYNLTGKYVAIKIIDAGSQANSQSQLYALNLQDSNDVDLQWVVYGGYMAPHIDYTYVGDPYYIPYAANIWVRIRESGGITYWDYSTNDGVDWVNLYSVANPAVITDLSVDTFMANWGAAGAVTGIVDSLTTNVIHGRVDGYKDNVYATSGFYGYGNGIGNTDDLLALDWGMVAHYFDNVRIYNGVLTQEEITALYNTGAGTTSLQGGGTVNHNGDFFQLFN
jgi:hypothetical protein